MSEFPESGPETKTWGQVFTGEVTWGAGMQDVEGKPIKGVFPGQRWRPQGSALQETPRRVWDASHNCPLQEECVGIYLPVPISAGWESPRGVNSPHSELHLWLAEQFYSRGRKRGGERM